MPRKGENIYKRKDGRWEGRYKKSRKPDGSIYYGYLYGKKYQEVKQKLLQMNAQLLLKESEVASGFTGTFQEWANFWLEEIAGQTVKRSTYSSYESKLSVHLLPVLGELSLKQLTEKTLQQLIKKFEQTLSAGSVHAIMRVLRTCLNEAIRRGHLRDNPCHNVQLPPIVSRPSESLEQAQYHLLKQAAKKGKHGLPVLLSLETGLRLGEICGLKWSDIDFNQQLLYVNRTLQRVRSKKGKTMITEGTPKTLHSIRRIPLSPTLCAELQKRQAKAKGTYVISDGIGPVEPRVVQYRFQKLAQKVNIKATFHTLRHSFATRCLEFGVTIATISALLGHSSIKMTLDVYTHSTRLEERTAIAQLAAL